MVCELRRTYPRWGAQRIAHELSLRGVEAPPPRSSVYRILVRHGLVAAQEQNRKRKNRALGTCGLRSIHRGYGRLRCAFRSVDQQRETVHGPVHQAVSDGGSIRTDRP